MLKRIASVVSGLTLAAGLVAVTAQPAQAQQIGGFDFSRPEVVATGLQVPWGLAFLPNGDALVGERNSGRVLRVRPGSTPQVVATISGVTAIGEGGLLGLAVSPTFTQDNYVYAYYTSANDNRVIRFSLNSPQTQETILTGIPRGQYHNGGRIAFGPDRLLYISTGDAGQSANSQNLNSLGGKILRIHPDGTVPSDNPFPGSPVYSLGHRNVQGLAWDSDGRLYVSELGQNAWDEVNHVVPGGNYGWPIVEGIGSDPNYRNPIVTWRTSEASPSGAAIANDTLFVAALRGQRLWAVPLDGSGGAGTPTAVLQGAYGRLRTVAVGPDGWLWLTNTNRDGAGFPRPNDDQILRFPPVGSTPPSTPPITSSPPNTSQPPLPSGCTATYRIANQWSGGFQAEVTVTNSGTSPINGWTVRWTFSNGQTVTQGWGGIYTQSGAEVTVRNQAWNGVLGPGASTTTGFIGTWNNATNAVPTLSCTSS